MTDGSIPRLRVLSTLAMIGAMRELSPAWEAQSGRAVDADFAPTVALLARLRGGEAADIAIVTDEALEELTAEGLILPGSRVDVARSYVGIAVRAGGAKPDISTQAALRATLLAARSIAYSRIGASGIFFAGLIERLGIADAVRAKATIIPTGFTAELAARGEVELAVQQVSELLAVPGIELVGKLPADIQTVATFSAGLQRDSEAARSLLRFLTGPSAASVLRRSGLEPSG